MRAGHTEQFWHYSLRLYANKKVQAACLTLQDSYCCNVNILLFCCYCECLGYTLSEAQLLALHLAIAPTDLKLTSMRKHRRQLKDTHALQYKMMLTNELELERQQQQALVARWEKGKQKAASGRFGTADNLSCYRHFLHTQYQYPLADTKLMDILKKYSHLAVTAKSSRTGQVPKQP